MTKRTLNKAVSVALLLTVVSQVFYVFVVSEAGDETMLRPLTWLTELAAFSVIAVGSHSLMTRDTERAMIWSAIAFAGLLNVLQVAMGLSMFKPALEAGEGQEQLFATVLAGAFFLYFLAKLVLGLVALVLGYPTLKEGTAITRGLGGLAVLAGAASVVTNGAALVASKEWMFAAGAAGTAATAFLGIHIWRIAHRDAG